ncbi:hypothetical protein O3P69_000523 [Scylla paramamosain]|uniref:Uncharacterized protein n=1 Tax=Scylla paramamosain TaxID=85552 RepID=A0AAW0UTY6_SCYPA
MTTTTTSTISRQPPKYSATTRSSPNSVFWRVTGRTDALHTHPGLHSTQVTPSTGGNLARKVESKYNLARVFPVPPAAQDSAKHRPRHLHAPALTQQALVKLQ